jgi:RES domain-containing protein
MTVYRCTLKKWAHDLSGQGAFLYGGRWNTVGHHALYTAENNLLAALEVAIRIPLTKISSEYVMVPIDISSGIEVYEPRLTKGWNSKISITQKVGDLFLEENKYLAMKVPSALMSNTYNFLLNPKHKLFSKMKAGKSESLLFDDRLVKMMTKENG